MPEPNTLLTILHLLQIYMPAIYRIQCLFEIVSVLEPSWECKSTQTCLRSWFEMTETWATCFSLLIISPKERKCQETGEQGNWKLFSSNLTVSFYIAPMRDKKMSGTKERKNICFFIYSKHMQEDLFSRLQGVCRWINVRFPLFYPSIQKDHNTLDSTPAQ